MQDLSAAPPFTLRDLREAIPEECWQRDTAKSFAYLVKDVAIVLGLAAGAFAIDSWCVCVARRTVCLAGSCGVAAKQHNNIVAC